MTHNPVDKRAKHNELVKLLWAKLPEHLRIELQKPPPGAAKRKECPCCLKYKFRQKTRLIEHVLLHCARAPYEVKEARPPEPKKPVIVIRWKTLENEMARHQKTLEGIKEQAKREADQLRRGGRPLGRPRYSSRYICKEYC